MKVLLAWHLLGRPRFEFSVVHLFPQLCSGIKSMCNHSQSSSALKTGLLYELIHIRFNAVLKCIIPTIEGDMLSGNSQITIIHIAVI